MVANQTDLSSNLLWLRSTNAAKFTAYRVIGTEKNVLDKKFTNRINMDYPLRISDKNHFIESKHKDSPVKNKFRVQRSIKKTMLTVFWVIKRLAQSAGAVEYTDCTSAEGYKKKTMSVLIWH